MQVKRKQKGGGGQTKGFHPSCSALGKKMKSRQLKTRNETELTEQMKKRWRNKQSRMSLHEGRRKKEIESKKGPS